MPDLLTKISGTCEVFGFKAEVEKVKIANPSVFSLQPKNVKRLKASLIATKLSKKLKRMEETLQYIIGKYNYWAAIILLLIGLYGMIAKNNLMKKVIGMSIFQAAIILFYVSIGEKKGATIPILSHGHSDHAVEHAIEAVQYANPLPHVLMLTAIVVGVSTLGVALAILQKVYRVHRTIEEDEILETIDE